MNYSLTIDGFTRSPSKYSILSQLRRFTFIPGQKLWLHRRTNTNFIGVEINKAYGMTVSKKVANTIDNS
jgi:hypothetical protein